MTPLRAASALLALGVSSLCAHARAACDGAQTPAVRIEYGAEMPMLVVAMAPRSEVRRVFPDVKGVTSRTVYVTPETYVEVERGQTLKSEVAAPGGRAPGIHLNDKKGNVIEWVGYEKVPLTLMRIETRTEAITYSSLQGRATYERRGVPPDEATSAFLGFLENDLPLIGKRTIAGTECTAKRMPMLGEKTEACVVKIDGWPVALELKLTGAGDETSSYRATRIDRGVCIERADLELPRGTKIEVEEEQAEEESDEP